MILGQFLNGVSSSSSHSESIDSLDFLSLPVPSDYRSCEVVDGIQCLQ